MHKDVRCKVYVWWEGEVEVYLHGPSSKAEMVVFQFKRNRLHTT